MKYYVGYITILLETNVKTDIDLCFMFNQHQREND